LAGLLFAESIWLCSALQPRNRLGPMPLPPWRSYGLTKATRDLLAHIHGRFRKGMSVTGLLPA